MKSEPHFSTVLSAPFLGSVDVWKVSTNLHIKRREAYEHTKPGAVQKGIKPDESKAPTEESILPKEATACNAGNIYLKLSKRPHSLQLAELKPSRHSPQPSQPPPSKAWTVYACAILTPSLGMQEKAQILFCPVGGKPTPESCNIGSTRTSMNTPLATSQHAWRVP